MNVDELNIVIKVDSGNAIAGLDSIIAKITELNEVTGRGSNNIASLRDLADSMRLLGVAGRAISDIKLSGFENVYNGASMLGNINADLISEKINTISPALERLGYASTSFNADTKFMGASVSSLVKSLNSLTGLKPNGLDTAEPIFARLKVMLADFPRGVGREMINVANGLTQVSASMNKFVPPSMTSWQIFESFLRRISPTLKAFGEDSLSGSNSIHHLSIALKNLNALASETGLAENLRKVTGEISRFITMINSSVSDADLERFTRIAEALYQVSDAYQHLATATQKAGTAGAYGARNISSTLNQFLTNLKKAVPQVISFGKKIATFITTPFRRFGAAVLSAGNAIRGFFQRLGRVAMLRFMRMMIMKVVTALKEGIQNLYAWSAAIDHTFAQAMDTISTAGLYLKNSIAAMFSPLIEAIAPVLDAIVDKVVAFINVVNQLFALLSGRSVYTAAIKSAKAYGDAAGGAAAAQAELNRTVLAFDELNRLNGPNNSGGGGGGGASVGEGVFEVRDISELAERLFTDEDWTWLGELVTDKLTTQMESIDWSKIQTGVNSIATRFATFLNGAFGNTEFWTTLGTTVGEGLNTLTGGIDTFFQTTEWSTGGESFAAFLRSGIDTIDWEQLGRTITDVPRAVTQWIHGFVSEWDMEDWTELGDSIAKMVNAAFFNIDWATAIPDIVEMATGILHAINTAIEEIEWGEMFDKLKEGFENADWTSFWKEVGEFILNTTPVWTIAIGLIVGKAVVSTTAAAIRTMIINAIAGKLAGGAAGAAGGAAGGAGGLGAIGSALSGKLAAIGTVAGAVAIPLAIALAVSGAVILTVVMSSRRARENEIIQNRAEYDANMYRTALNEALEGEMIDKQTYIHGMAMTDALEDLWYSNQERNPWDVFGTEFRNEADAITEGLQNILYDTGYTTEHIHRNVSGKLGDTTEVTKKFIGDTVSSFGGLKETVSGDVEDMTESVTTDTQNMSIHSGRYIEGLRDKTISSLSTMKTDGSTYVEDLRKNVVDKLDDVKTKGTKSIGDLTKDIGDKLSKASTSVSTYGGNVGQEFANGISGKVSTVNTSVGKLVDKVKGLNLTDSGKTWGGNTGSKYAEGIETKVNTVGTSVGKLTNKAGGLNIKDTAYTWGTELGQKYADGINAKAWAVEQAAKSTADKVAKYIHFTEPDEGPLSNFHTFAPDMMRMYAQGIEDNKQLVLNQLQSLTADMSGVFANVGVNYNQTVETNYDGLIAALADREEAINVYIGNSKLDTVMARSTKRTDLRTGGR